VPTDPSDSPHPLHPHPLHLHHLPVDPDRDGEDEVVPGRPPVEHWDVALVVAAGGAIGGLARYATNELIGTAAGSFPWSTFAENVLGCLLLGALMVVLVELRGPSRYARPFLGVGVLGGYTTFSAYTSEIRALAAAGHAATAALYLAGSVVAGLLATLCGVVGTRAAARAASRRRGVATESA
jgi:CrcB protein